jgi:hypothetical protein
MFVGAIAQGRIAAALAFLWIGIGLFVYAFRPSGATSDGRFRFSIADILWLTALVALSLGILSNQQRITKWIGGDQNSGSK